MKKKIFMLTLVACLIVLSIAGSSLAYFTDTDAKTNVFTSGNVEITLNYNEENTKLYPGQTYTGKAASITNGNYDEAYVGAIIEITFAKTLSEELIKAIFTNIDTNTTFEYEEITGGYRIYCVVTNVLNSNNTAKIFDSISIPATWGHEEVSSLTAIKITGYAVQTVGFTEAATALTTAFDAWAGYPSIP